MPSNSCPRPLPLCPKYQNIKSRQTGWFNPSLLVLHVCAYSAPSHYLNLCWVSVKWTLRDNLLWNFNQNIKLFIHKNAFENIVCEMAAILSRGWGGDELNLVTALIACVCYHTAGIDTKKQHKQIYKEILVRGSCNYSDWRCNSSLVNYITVSE